MITSLLWTAGGLLNVAACVFWAARRFGGRLEAWPAENLLWAAGFGLWAVSAAMSHLFWLAAYDAGVVAAEVWGWWRRRKDRRRALAALGAKSLARLAAIVRKAREAAKPRPVLQPQRGGAS